MLPGVGVFGSGKLVHFLVATLREKGFKVSAIWALNDDAAQDIANQLSIPFFTSSIDVLLLRKEVQLIVICCPPHIHSSIVSKSFSIGKHVLCDWPTALNSSDVRRMVKAATYYPSLISVICHPLRFIRTFQLMRTLITAENYVGDISIVKAEITGSQLLDLGDRYTVECDHYMGGGLLTNIGSHFIDIISFVTDLKAKSVNGILKTYSHETDAKSPFRRATIDNFCNFQMEMESKDERHPRPIAIVTINNHLLGKFNYELTVCGSKGFLSIRGDNLYGYKSDSGSQEELLLQDDEHVSIASSKLIDSIPKPYTQGMTKLIESLRNAFSNGNHDSPVRRSVIGNCKPARDSPVITDNESKDSKTTPKKNEDFINDWFKDAVNVAANFEDGEYIQAVVDAVKNSSRNKQWVRVDYKLPFDTQKICKNCHNDSHPKIYGV